jgi:hypothetical protein
MVSITGSGVKNRREPPLEASILYRAAEKRRDDLKEKK